MIDPIARISKVLEDRFFFAESIVLREQLAKLKREEENIEALSKVSGIVNKSVLKELVALNIRPELMAAMCLVPILEVAWADGTIATPERKALLEVAQKHGFSADNEILQEWMKCRPAAPLMDAWKTYMQGICEILTKETLASLKSEILEHARLVAETSGALLFLTNPVSPSEKAILDSLESFFRQPGACQ